MRRLVGARIVGLRQRDRRNAEDGALDRAGDGAGIDHVLAGVAAAVDAGEDEIGPALLEQVHRAHDHAVGRRALDRVAALADRAQPQRIVERERVRDAGLVELRRHHPDVVGQRLADLGADVEPVGMDAVVVGDQDAHALNDAFIAYVRSSWLRPHRSATLQARRSIRPPAGRFPSPRSARGRPRRRNR